MESMDVSGVHLKDKAADNNDGNLIVWIHVHIYYMYACVTVCGGI